VIYEVPDSMKDEDAAGFIIPVHTAYHAVHRRGQVQSGETVLVLGAAGGVPSSAVQLCAAGGYRVIAVAGGSEKVASAKELGANVVIDHRQEDFAEAVLREIGPADIDAIIDFVQGEPGQRARPLLAVEGRYRSTTTRVIGIEDVPAALRDLAERRTLGRVVARF